jgi:type II secretory ATPase GspE/PulE/Tfp pilus assembly ATPase PilB-like protein
MFEFYRDENDTFEKVFILNNKITKGLIAKKILKMSDLDDYKMPSSLEEIIPFAETLTGDAKLLTNIISDTLGLESFLKVDKNDFNKGYLVGDDYVIVKNTYFTINPLSKYIEQLRKNLKRYKDNEISFNKIGYISSKDFGILKEALSSSKSKLNDQVLSNLKIDALFIDVLYKSIKLRASDLKILYRRSEVLLQYTIEKQLYEEALIKVNLENYNKLTSYLLSFFGENKVVIREMNGKKYKLTLTESKATEEFSSIDILNISIFNLEKKTPDFFEEFTLPLENKKDLERSIKNPYGLFVLSSKNHRKEFLYSLAIKEKELKPASKIYIIEREIERDFEGITQYKYKESSDWHNLELDSFSLIIVDEVKDKKDYDVVSKLIEAGKKVVIGLNSTSSLEAFAKLEKLSSNKEFLSDNLLCILQVEKVNKVCEICSTSIQLIKDKNFQELQKLEQAPKMSTIIKVENVKGCNNCYQGFKGLVGVAEYLSNDMILKTAILEGYKFQNLKIEKNSSSWMNIYENSMYLIENNTISTNAIVNNLGYPKKL